jgi:hypothetical protein
MTIASAMADSTPPAAQAAPTSVDAREPGAPIARDAIDPDLIKLSRQRPRVGVITAAGLVFLAIVAIVKLWPDRRFASSSDQPVAATVADLLAGNIDTDQLISVSAEPLVSHAIRVAGAKGTLGLRLVPARGTDDRLWLVVPGDGWEQAQIAGHVGRLRKLDDLALSAAARAYADEHPRPVFATAAAVRAGFASSRVGTVAGDAVALGDRDAIALDLIDPNTATIAAAFNDRLPDAAAWRAALDRAGLTPTATGATDASLGQVRFTVGAAVATATTRLQSAGLWAARVEPVTRHYATSWATLRRSPPAGLDVGGATLPDDQIDLIGLYVSRGIPAGAYAVVAGEAPGDYWYVTPITIALAVIALVFAWALIRAVRRDFLPARAG